MPIRCDIERSHNYHRHLCHILPLERPNRRSLWWSSTEENESIDWFSTDRLTFFCSVNCTVIVSDPISVIRPRRNPCSLSRTQMGLLPFSANIVQMSQSQNWRSIRDPLEQIESSEKTKMKMMKKKKRSQYWSNESKIRPTDIWVNISSLDILSLLSSASLRSCSLSVPFVRDTANKMFNWLNLSIQSNGIADRSERFERKENFSRKIFD